MLVCALVIFELAVIAVLLFVAIRNVKKQGNSYGIDMAAIFAVLNDINLTVGVTNASIDRSIRGVEAFKIDFDAKFGPDLINKLNAIFRLGQHPDKIILDKNGVPHKITPGY